MRIAILFILSSVFCWAQPSIVNSGAAHTLAQCKAANTSITTGTVCGGSTNPGSAINTTGASLLIACTMCYSGACSSPTDSYGNTWTALTNYTNSLYRLQMWYAIPADAAHVGAGHTFTLPASGSGIYNTIAVSAWAGTAAATAYRSGTDAGGPSGANVSVTPGAANDLVYSCESSDTPTAPTITGTFTILDSTNLNGNGETGGTAYRIAPSTSAVVWQWGTITAATNGAAFQVGPARSGGSVVRHRAWVIRR